MWLQTDAVFSRVRYHLLVLLAVTGLSVLSWALGDTALVRQITASQEGWEGPQVLDG